MNQQVKPQQSFLGRKIITSFHQLIMVSGAKNDYMVQENDRLVKEAEVQLAKAQDKHHCITICVEKC